jgi:DNA-binding NarL/FixJ family response regulator
MITTSMTTNNTTNESLTGREIELARLFVQEAMTNTEAAMHLGLSPKTVEAHKWNIYRKLGVRNVAGLANCLRGELYPKAKKLTPRQEEVVALLRKAYTNQQIAKELGIADNTVKRHLQNIYAGMGNTRSRRVVLATTKPQ